jgi:biopolymer transport protein ExbB
MNNKKICSLISLLLIWGLSFAQEAAKEAGKKLNAGTSIGGIIHDSGTIFATLILGMLALAIVYGVVKIRRIIILEKIDAGKFYLKLKGYVKNDEIDEAIKICDSFKRTTLGFIFWSGFSIFRDARKSGKKGSEMRDSVQNAFDEASLQTIPGIDSGLFWFDLFAQVAMLLGLLGTVWGLIGSFNALATAAPVDQSRLLTIGIKTAMGTTALGLICAIPIQFLRSWLQTSAEKVINEIDEYSIKMINQINNTIKD